MGNTREEPCEAGFGIVEIVVSMFLLAILAMAFLPLLIQSVRASASNASMVTATQLVQNELELARNEPKTCSAIKAFGLVVPAATTDSRGVSYQPSRAADPCSTVLTDYPRTVRFSVSVAVTGSTNLPVSATTLLYLEAP